MTSKPNWEGGGEGRREGEMSLVMLKLHRYIKKMYLEIHTSFMGVQMHPEAIQSRMTRAPTLLAASETALR